MIYKEGIGVPKCRTQKPQLKIILQSSTLRRSGIARDRPSVTVKLDLIINRDLEPYVKCDSSSSKFRMAPAHDSSTYNQSVFGVMFHEFRHAISLRGF
jgi:hypothetical protein